MIHATSSLSSGIPEAQSAKPQVAARSSAPIFIVGAQRSGTTMFRLMLNAHPRIAIPYETDFIHKYEARASEFGDLTDDANVARLVDAIRHEQFVARGGFVCGHAGDVLDLLEQRTMSGVVDALFTLHARSKGKQRWGDKTPGVVDVLRLYRLFPDACFIHMIRDGRDVALSRRRSWSNRSVLRSAHAWAFIVSSIRRASPVLGDKYMELRYEDLVAQPQEMLERVCQFIGEKFDPAMLEYHLHNPEGEMPSSAKIMEFHKTSIQPPNRSKVFEWRTGMSASDRYLFERIAGELLWDLNYPKAPFTRWDRIRARMTAVRYALAGKSVFLSPALE
jgi:Sulfotransferase family